MSSWGNRDLNIDAPKWAVTQVNLEPTQDNANALFDNTTANTFASTLGDGSVRMGEITVGLFAVDAQEEGASSSTVTHPGWVLRTVGQGGRAGRVTQETLVCMNTIVGDSDGQVYPNVAIMLVGPSNGEVTSDAGNTNSVTFTVTPTLSGNTAANLTYQWQVNGNFIGSTWVDMADGNDPQPGGVQKSGVTTNELTITPWDTTANNYLFRCIVTAQDEGVSATSANGLITIY